MKLLVLPLLGICFSFVLSGSSEPNISCLIVNLEYVNCTWTASAHNYRFKSRFKQDSPLECPEYHRMDGVNVGCMLPYEKVQRFRTFQTWLYNQNGSLVTNQDDFLKERVKLSPPNNLSVVERDLSLGLFWNITKGDGCVESEVRYRTDKNNWKNILTATKKTYSLSFPSKTRYEFQVRARVESSCGQSLFWSDWSESVYWGTVKPNNGTDILDPESITSTVLFVVGGTILLVVLACLLVHNERLRIILIPVVPNSGQKFGNYFANLFEKYDGNIDDWLSMPKDLENSFKPNFSERACPVREYRMLSQSSSDSESILSNPTDVSSDYQSMCRYSSASTLPEPTQTPQIQSSPHLDIPV